MMNLRQHRAGFVQHMVFHRIESARQGEVHAEENASDAIQVIVPSFSINIPSAPSVITLTVVPILKSAS